MKLADKMGIHLGDCLEIMKKLPGSSVDSVVTDPPYGLEFMGKEWDKLQRKIWRGGNKYPDGADKFTGTRPAYIGGTEVQEWHYQWAKECLRVLKPGGHLLSFGGTRTYHRMACAVEDAGFEIRDCIFWVYGSGFPKSLNIGKAVDKLQGNEREVIGTSKGKGYSSIQEKNIEQNNRPYVAGLPYLRADRNLTKGNSPWEGWGTSLKPAVEPIVLARKPLSEKNVAENVLKWRTGGINIDGCRVATTDVYSYKKCGGSSFSVGRGVDGTREYPAEIHNLGRFPANLIHDGSEEVVGMFPQSQGMASQTDTKDTPSNYFGLDKHAGWRFGRGDNGSAARFFYCAKASKAERNMGLEGLPALDPHTTYAGDACALLTMGNTPTNYRDKVKNNHPTVKPVALMRYLCRLITPPNGTVLDPFMGSGSTGIAAKMEGFNFIGIEKDQEYFKIAEARIKEAEHSEG